MELKRTRLRKFLFVFTIQVQNPFDAQKSLEGHKYLRNLKPDSLLAESDTFLSKYVDKYHDPTDPFISVEKVEKMQKLLDKLPSNFKEWRMRDLYGVLESGERKTLLEGLDQFSELQHSVNNPVQDNIKALTGRNTGGGGYRLKKELPRKRPVDAGPALPAKRPRLEFAAQHGASTNPRRSTLENLVPNAA